MWRKSPRHMVKASTRRTLQLMVKLSMSVAVEKPMDGETLSGFQFCQCKLLFITLTIIFFFESLKCSLECLTHDRQDLRGALLQHLH
jgi:hypothetical protein